MGFFLELRLFLNDHSSLASIRGRFGVFSAEVSLLFCFAFQYAADTNFILTWLLPLLLHSPLARAPYVVLFDLKPQIEDGVM